MNEPDPDNPDSWDWDPEPVRWHNVSGGRVILALLTPIIFLLMVWALILAIVVDLWRSIRGRQRVFFTKEPKRHA